MPKKRETNEKGEYACRICGEFKPQDQFIRGDSYCRPCRKEYSAEYHARRRQQDPTYLAVKAAKARRNYRMDPEARAARIDSAAKYRSKIEDQMKAAEQGKPSPAVTEKAKEKESKQVIHEKWQDL